MPNVTKIAVSLCRKLSHVYSVVGLLVHYGMDYWRFIDVFGVADFGMMIA